MDYDASSIKILKGLEAVRKRPAMYIGGTGKEGFHHLLWEILDNSVDEYLAGHCNKITVQLYEDGSIAVADNGRGIPVDIHPTAKKPAVEVVFTHLHAGGKFDGKIYQVSGGLHGVGAAVVNALSEFLEVWVRRDGKIYYQKYVRGVPQHELKIIGESKRTGTEVRFKPDPEIFGNQHFDINMIRQRLKELAFLNPGLKILFIHGEEKEEFFSKKGLEDFLMHLAGEKKPLHKPIIISGEAEGLKISCGLFYVNDFGETLYSYVNDIRTTEGGTHVSGFRSALTKAIKEFGKKDAEKITGEDTRQGLVAVLSVLVPNPQFEGQTKKKLGNTDVKRKVDSFLYNAFLNWFRKKPKIARTILTRVLKNTEFRLTAAKTRELLKKKAFGDVLPGKLADCSDKDPTKRELFIVEGESAGGSAKQARDRRFQAILPLKGKILNVEKASWRKVLSNDEIKAIFTALGLTPGKEEFNPRYGKVIIMTDADIDGSHIRTLLLALFYRYLRKVIESGGLYVVRPPLYRIRKGDKLFYAYSDEEKEEVLRQLKNAEVQRFKGLGEMNPDQLWKTAMDPERRKLIQISIEDAEKADAMISLLMGENVAERRKFIIENAHLAKNIDV